MERRCTVNQFLIIITVLLVFAAFVGLVLLAVELRRITRRPSPFGGAPDKPEPCPHCGRRIEHDDAVRSVAGHLPMHERCARERQAVRS